MTPGSSRIPGFYNLPLAERLEALRAAGELEAADLAALSGAGWAERRAG